MNGRVTLLFGPQVSLEIDACIATENGTVTLSSPSGNPFCAACGGDLGEVYDKVGQRCLRYRYPGWIDESMAALQNGFDFTDLFTLCYDDFLDSSVFDPQDGFDPVGSIYEGRGAYSVFNSELVFETDGRNSLNHLNGSVFMSRHAGPDDDCPMYKFDSPPRVMDVPGESGRPVTAFSPLIPGDAGLDAFLYEPFRSYRAHLVQCVSCGRRLVVAGFRFEDPFISELIRSFASGDGNKVLFVDTSAPDMFSLTETPFGGQDASGHVLWFRGSFRDIGESPLAVDVLESFRSGPDRVRD